MTLGFLSKDHLFCLLTFMVRFRPQRVPRAEGFDHVFEPHTHWCQQNRRAQRHEIRLDVNQTHRAHHRSVIDYLLLLSAQSVTLTLCLESRPVGAYLAHKCVPLQCKFVWCGVRLFMRLSFDRAGRRTFVVHSRSTCLRVIHAARKRNLNDPPVLPATERERELRDKENSHTSNTGSCRPTTYRDLLTALSLFSMRNLTTLEPRSLGSLMTSRTSCGRLNPSLPT